MRKKITPEYLREKWRKYAYERESIYFEGQDMIVKFYDNTRKILKFIGEFNANKNDLSKIETRTETSRMRVSDELRVAADKLIIRVYRNTPEGEVLTHIVGNEIDSKPKYNYFESTSEFGLMFSGNFRYVLVEKTLPDSLIMHLA
ncbi:MAG: hypothetical protein Q8O88_04065 [bacterium]|nr:hypothetical protein [bacterium]